MRQISRNFSKGKYIEPSFFEMLSKSVKLSIRKDLVLNRLLNAINSAVSSGRTFLSLASVTCGLN